MRNFKVEVLAGDYERAHGKAPRGAGNWAFCLVNPSRADYLEFVVWANGSYADAKRAAVAVLNGKQGNGLYQPAAGKPAVHVSFGPAVASALESGRPSVLYVCS